MWQFLKGDPTLPVVFGRVAGLDQVSRSFPDGDTTGSIHPDISIDIGIGKILADGIKGFYGIFKIIPVLCPV